MEEVSNAKITVRFVIKLVLLFVLIDLIIGAIVLLSWAGSIDKVDSDNFLEMIKSLNGLIFKLIIVNVLAIAQHYWQLEVLRKNIIFQEKNANQYLEI